MRFSVYEMKQRKINKVIIDGNDKCNITGKTYTQ